MKNLSNYFVLVALLGIALVVQAQPASSPQATNLPSPTPYRVISRDGNSQVWEKTTYERSPAGKIIPHKHHVTELATGLNYWDGKQWSPSIPSFQVSDDGQSVFARSLQHKVQLAANLNADSSVNITTPDGIVLHTTPVAIGLYDETTSNTVIIAAITNCSGTLISSNQVVYENAFDNIDADIVYTLKRGSFSQDIVLKQDVDPVDYGLSSNSTIEIFTEFYRPMAPKVIGKTLRFGLLSFGQGKAYTTASTNQNDSVPVTKKFTTVAGRTFLIESTKYNSLRKELKKLPQGSASQSAKAKSIKIMNGRYANIPSPHATTKATVLIRQREPLVVEINQPKGIVMDYEALDGTMPEPMVFQGDTTYFISGWVDCEDVVFEGGTVIKYPNDTSADIEVDNTVTCNTGPYRPAVFTAGDDDSVGESMNSVLWGGYSGVIQTNGYANPAIDYEIQNGAQPSEQLENCRFLYAQQACLFDADLNSGIGISLYDCQLLHCNEGVQLSVGQEGYIVLANCLVAYVNLLAYDAGNFGPDNLQCYDSTIDNCSTIYTCDNNQGDEVTSANSIFSNCNLQDGPPSINWYGYANGFYNCGGTFGDVTYTDNNSPYKTVGGGSYYLADSTFRGIGTDSIDGELTVASGATLYYYVGNTTLLDLATKTTVPPIVYDVTNVSSLGALSPTVPRDTNSLSNADLGYHYDALDYVFGGCDLYSNLTITSGTAVGWFEDYGTNLFAPDISYDDYEPYAISLNDGANLSFTGDASQPNYFAKSDMVQEGEGTNWTNRGFVGGIMLNGNSTIPQLSANFTIFTHRESEDNLFRDNYANGGVFFQNCEFYTVGFATYDMQYANFTNCLLFRCDSFYSDSMNSDYYLGYAIDLDYDNCTFYNGGLEMDRYDVNNNFESSFWQVENCAFDGTAIECFDDVFSELGLNNTLFNYNSYNTNNVSWQTCPYINTPTNTLEFVGPQDLFVTNYNWESGQLGSFYLPSDSPLIGKGSTNASLLGLADFTTQTNQAPEYTKTVDIGYHYLGIAGFPGIIEQPTDCYVVVNGSAYFSVTAGGAMPLSYQWFSPAGSILGATNSSLTLTNVSVPQEGYYYVQVSNAIGSVISSSALLTVIPWYEAADTNNPNSGILQVWIDSPANGAVIQ